MAERLIDIRRLADPFSLTITTDPIGDPYAQPWDDLDAPYSANEGVTHDAGVAITFELETSGAVTFQSVYWRFGDGFIGEGESVEHTYKFAMPGIIVHVCTQDTLGRKVCQSRIMTIS